MIVLLICNEKEGKKQEVNLRKKWKTAIFIRFIEKKKKKFLDKMISLPR